MATSPPLKRFSFGICNFGRTLPNVNALSPDTQILNIEIAFEGLTCNDQILYVGETDALDCP